MTKPTRSDRFDQSGSETKASFPARDLSTLRPQVKSALFTGGKDRPYAFGLAMGLVAQNVLLDVVGSDEVDSPEMHATAKLQFLNLHGTTRRAILGKKIARILEFYYRLARLTATGPSKILHILWNNNFEFLDRTLLMICYRLLGKKIALTAHNINAGERDLSDSC